ncbi:stage III sporulation protein AD [Clostridium amylolyticum]|uniref:Stage III sporulation protein AD n=1 Tax=Clostridium amylolyticum TaxID=1121298 RepID=A0A1M6KHW6_9CLOT|nr:stage III sporulation protein AD [Clostridium amylolyticum]SHJ58527.1 stage III sporulation protein AD [Clostridium amylolyticum]
MEIFKIVSFGLVAVFLFLLFKDKRSDLSVLIALIASIVIFLFILDKISMIFHFMQEIAVKANIDTVYLNIVLKIIGIAFISSLGSEVCKDAGANTIANKIELSGKILILTLAIPILMSLLDSILKIM